MRFRVLFRRVICAGALALMCAPVASAAPATSLKVLTGSGTTNSGQFTAGPAGAELRLPSGTTLRLSPDAALRAFGRPQQLELDHGGKTETWSLSLLRGRLDLDVPVKPRSALLVSTDKGSVIVTSGKATLISAPGELYVVNAGGQVRTYIQSHFTNLAEGRAARIDAEHPRGSDEAVLAAPAFTAGPRMWFSAGDRAKISGLVWSPIAGATAYQLELSRAGEVIARERSTEPRLRSVLAELAPGEYDVAVRAVDSRGIDGRWSPQRKLRVIGVEMPVGAYSAGDGIFLAGGQQVRFSHTDGLEMTYVGAGRYISASESVGLYRNERTIISFRFPGSGDSVIARLEPRDVFAEVTAGPKKALWPRDPIDLHVRMRTRAGGPVPTFLEVVPRVQLGVEPLDVEWRREGNDLFGRVQPQTGKGPWVIRVEVSDQFGIALGRDFVEVLHQGRVSPAPREGNEKTSVRVASARRSTD
jgi:hypothetical protein